MKLLFFSDIHGIDKNLNYIKELDKKEQFDKIVVLGDLYYQGLYDNSNLINSIKVKDFLTGYQERLICLRGNCDSDVDIKASDFPICDNLVLINVDGINLYCTHGHIYNIDKNRKFQRSGVLIYGHHHYPYIEQKDKMTYICVGSISQPRNNSMPSYGVYINKTFTIYDINGKEIEKINL